MRIETTVLQSAATTGNGTVLPSAHYDGLVIYMRSNGTTTAGAVQIEEDLDGSATTWAAIGSATTVTGTNNVLSAHLDGKVYGNLRARISTTVTGATVTVTAVGRVKS